MLSQEQNYSVVQMCKSLEVSKSAYYSYRSGIKNGQDLSELDHSVISIFWRHKRRYGSRRIVADRLIVHSDGGGQYGSKVFRRLLSNTESRQSMTRRDNHYDNATAESWFSRLKAELLEDSCFDNLEHARSACFEYIDAYYNTIRRHSSLDYKTPLQFERELVQRN